MTPTPQIEPLSHKRRVLIFIFSILIFVITVPLLVFYAIGYRIDIFNAAHSIESVGGMYISADAPNIAIYVDNQPVQDMRLFQRAAYIQNLSQGEHEVHVQGAGLQTWVKKLPVFAHYVTEAQSFNMPVVPQIRLVTKWQTSAGLPVVFQATSTLPMHAASSTTNILVATSTATSTYVANPEYTYIVSLFASSTAQAKEIAAAQAVRSGRAFVFGGTPAAATSSATTTKTYRDTSLYEKNGEVYITWTGRTSDAPYYYCVRYQNASTTSALYGSHVTATIEEQFANVFAAHEAAAQTISPVRICRSTIRIDRKNQQVISFDYFPGSRDLVLMHLTDGIYVVEADDRAWQNTQMLYPGQDLQMVVDGGRIYVKQGRYYFEVYTALQ